jgi:hypothetical protein
VRTSPQWLRSATPPVIGYEVARTDANGIATEPFPVTYTCVLE